MKVLVKTCVLSMFVVACGQNNASDGKAIATDLTSDEFDQDAATYLYWVEGDEVTRGQCDAENGFITRTACSQQVESMDYETFKEALDNGLSGYIARLENQVADLTTMIDTVSSQIEATKTELASVEADVDMTSDELRAAREEMVYLEDVVFEYRRQVELIEAQLARTKAYDLETLSELVAEDLERARVILSSIYNAVAEIEGRLASLIDYAEGLRSKLGPLMEQLELLSADLTATQTELAVSRELFRIYENTLVKLESEINFYVLSDHEHLFEANRRYVRLFSDIFATAAH